MIISFTNVIGAIQSLVKKVITDNLKMWLGFETSETLGREEVVNGDFSTDSDWNVGTGWDIDEANNKATHTGTGGTIKQALSDLIVGEDYVASVTLNSVGDTTLSNTSFQIRNNADTVSIAQLLSQDAEILPNTINYLTLNFTATEVNNIIRVFSEDNIFVTDFSIKQPIQITPDKSGNNNVGELFTGKALDFDGAGDYVDVSGFSMSGNNATFAFWAYIEENEKGDYFFDFHSTSTRFILGFGQTSRELAIYSGGWQDFGNPPQDQWVRIVLTVKGTIAKCFVDGVQLGADKTISAYDFSSPTTAHIGARYTPETFPKYYQGLLSDFQVYDKPWLNEDIAYDYANPQNLVTDRDNTTIELSNLKAYWAMSEGAGSLTYDSSGEGNNGTINGATYEPAQPRIPQLGMMNFSNGAVATGVTLIPDPNNTSQDIDGNAVRDRLNSFNLDGSGYASVANSNSIKPTSALSIECWIKTPDVSSASKYISDAEVGATRFFLMQVGSKARFKIATTEIDSATNLTNNSWHYIAGTWDGTTMKLYVDEDTPVTVSKSGAITYDGDDLFIGSRLGTGEYFDGLISDVRLYDRALTSYEVKNNYNAGLSAHTN